MALRTNETIPQFVYVMAAYATSLTVGRHRTGSDAGRGVYLLHAPPVTKAAQVAVFRFAIGCLVRLLAIWAFSLLAALELTQFMSRSPGAACS